MALSPDKTLLLTAQQGEGGRAVEHAPTCSLVASYPEDTQSFFTTAAFSADGSEFVTAGGDGFGHGAGARRHVPRATSARRGDQRSRLQPGRHAAGHGERGRHGDGDRPSRRERRPPRSPGTRGRWTTIAFAPTGDLVATGGEDGAVELWRRTAGRRSPHWWGTRRRSTRWRSTPTATGSSRPATTRRRACGRPPAPRPAFHRVVRHARGLAPGRRLRGGGTPCSSVRDRRRSTHDHGADRGHEHRRGARASSCSAR